MEALLDTDLMNNAKFPLYYSTQSLCPVCNNLVPGKVITKNKQVFIERECPEHGYYEGLICSDIEWYEHLPQFFTEGTKPLNPVNSAALGCPKDCGLCTSHSQICGILAIELTNKCNINCPACLTYISDSFELTVQEVEDTVNNMLKNQSIINTVTLTGGEPTIHPKILEILDVLNRPEIENISINTNGVRIATDEEFVKQLATKNKIYVSMHYDGVHSKQLRGIDHSVQIKAAEMLSKYNIDMVPAILAAKSYNDLEIGSIIKHLLTTYTNVRSITVSLMTYTGGNGSSFEFNPLTRLTIPEALESIEKSSNGEMKKSDFVPIPMPNPMCTATGYFLLMDNEITSLFQFAELDKIIYHLKNGHFASLTAELFFYIRDTINEIYASPDKYPNSEKLINKFKNLYSLLSADSEDKSSKDLEMIVSKYLKVVYMFQLMDSWSFDSKRLSRCSCQHGFPDGRIIPTCSFYCYHQNFDKRNTKN